MMERLVKKGLYGAAFLGLVLLFTLPLQSVILAVQTWNDVRSVQAALDGGETAVSPALRALVRDARVWRLELSPLLDTAPSFAWLPVYGGDLAQAPELTAFADAVLNAAVPTLVLYEGLERRFSEKDAFGAALISFAQENAGQLEAAETALERARAARARIEERDLSPKAHALLMTADRSMQEWAAALHLLKQGPALLGSDAPRYYLVLAQNNDEIRPTGGFISAVGVLRVERGEIGVEWFGDSFAADDLSLIHPPPPAPLQKYMEASQWLLRDANWYANFPTTADLVESMYARDRHLKTDGVIAVDVRFLPRLVGAMGEVELQGQPLAPENVIGLLKASWKPMPPGDMSAAWFNSDRKNFLADLLNGMLARFRTGDVKTGALAQALWRGLSEKSVQVYLNDTDAQRATVDAGWGGAVNTAGGDRLLVVDSNVGFNKVNAVVTREILYTVDLGNPPSPTGGGTATVEILYKNPSRAAEGGCDLIHQHKDNTYAGMEQSCYWNYVRVLAPQGSRFVAAEGVADAGVTDDIDGVTAFGGYAIIPRNTIQTVKFSYSLPGDLIRNNTYTLHVQQQAGQGETPVTVRVRVPAGMAVRGTTHPFVWRADGVLEFHETLGRDTTIQVYFYP